MLKHAALLSLLASAAAFAAPATVPGNWTITGDVQGYPVSETCTFTVDSDNKLTGKCKLQEKSYDATGKVDGKTVTFTHGGEYEGQPLTITYSGSLSDDGGMGGSIDVQPLQAAGTFTAKKDAEKKEASL